MYLLEFLWGRLSILPLTPWNRNIVLHSGWAVDWKNRECKLFPSRHLCVSAFYIVSQFFSLFSSSCFQMRFHFQFVFSNCVFSLFLFVHRCGFSKATWPLMLCRISWGVRYICWEYEIMLTYAQEYLRLSNVIAMILRSDVLHEFRMKPNERVAHKIIHCIE